MNGKGGARRRVHITGASGVGTTTLGRGLADRLSCAHVDTDDYYWLASDPPYRLKREMPERLRLLGQALQAAPAWVLSGSLSGWGDPLIPMFDLVVFPCASDVSAKASACATALAPGGSMSSTRHSWRGRL
jgi:hypothetical protein